MNPDMDSKMNNTDNTQQDLANEMTDRNRIIVRTSIIGILANILLAGFKAVIGIFSHSIAVVLDAVNNLSDALSSVITIIGAKLANRLPDKKHPMGHGRTEYLSAMIVSAIVLYAGITSAVESVKKIIHPETPDYKVISLIIIAVAVVVKLILGRYVKSQGEKANSAALEASGSDATFDAILSASVLACALIFIVTGVSLEAYVGVIISIFIIKSGLEMMKETLDDIIGHRADPELTVQIKRLLAEEPEVRGAYDLFLTDYGPGKYYATVHLELPDTMTVDEVDQLTRRVQVRIFRETGVVLTGVGVYSYNTTDKEAAEIRSRVLQTVKQHKWALQMHGFYVDTEKKTMRFDVVMSFDIDPKEGLSIICREVQELYPEYQLAIVPDVDLSD